MGVLEKIDPFYWFDRFWFRYIGKPETSVEKAVYFTGEVFYALFVAYVVYVVLGLMLHTSKPAVIVASQSMEPVLWPGDVVLIHGSSPDGIRAPAVDVNVPIYGKTLRDTPIRLVHNGYALKGFEVNGRFIPLERNGSIIVYYNDVYHVDIVHRAVLRINAPDGVFFITKGDNQATNPTADQDCSFGPCIYPYPVPYSQVYGVAFFSIPRIGIVKLWLARLFH